MLIKKNFFSGATQTTTIRRFRFRFAGLSRPATTESLDRTAMVTTTSWSIPLWTTTSCRPPTRQSCQSSESFCCCSSSSASPCIAIESIMIATASVSIYTSTRRTTTASEWCKCRASTTTNIRWRSIRRWVTVSIRACWTRMKTQSCRTFNRHIASPRTIVIRTATQTRLTTVTQLWALTKTTPSIKRRLAIATTSVSRSRTQRPSTHPSQVHRTINRTISRCRCRSGNFSRANKHKFYHRRSFRRIRCSPKWRFIGWWNQRKTWQTRCNKHVPKLLQL